MQGGRQQLLVPGWQMQSLDQPQHSQRQLVSDVISHRDSNGWLPRTSLLSQLSQLQSAAAAVGAVVNVVTCLCNDWF